MVLGIAVISAILLLSDREALFDAVASFDMRLIPLILLLTLANYALRFVKWEYYLRRVGVTQLALGTSALIFVSGFSMAMTPGKVGEFLKSLLVRARTGTPMTRTLPVVFAERLTDGLSMVILSTVGLLAFRVGWPLFLLMSAVLGSDLAVHSAGSARRISAQPAARHTLSVRANRCIAGTLSEHAIVARVPGHWR